MSKRGVIRDNCELENLSDNDDQEDKFLSPTNMYDAVGIDSDLEDIGQSPKWYKIVIDDHSNQPKSTVFEMILMTLEPHEFVPILNEASDDNIFYILNSNMAMNKIKELNNIFSCNNSYFKLKIYQVNCSFIKVNAIETIDNVLLKRFTMGANQLDLSNFNTDPDLVDKIYFPIWQSGNQSLIARRLAYLKINSDIHSLDLSGNLLRKINGFSFEKIFKNLKSLNLSNNLIKDMLDILQCRFLTSLWLDGNDLCLNYITEEEYIAPVLVLCPNLRLLDDKQIFKLGRDQIPHAVRNFSTNTNSVPLVNAFMEKYFPIFDSENRSALTELYSPNVHFSLTCTPKLDSNFGRKSSNLIIKKNKRSDSTNIWNLFKYFPKTKHDPLTFTVDVPFFNEKSVVIHISGVFKIPSTSLAESEQIYEFTRTFILTSDTKYRYRIINDMLHVTALLTERSENAFTLNRTTKEDISLIPPVLDEVTINGLTNIFMSLTALSYSESVSILTKNNWNIQLALVDAILMKMRTT